MPSVGVPVSKSVESHRGAAASETLRGPPDRMTPAGRRARIFSIGESGGQISEYTDSSRSRRAINCVYCDPKSRTRMVWWFKEQACPERHHDPGSRRAAPSDTEIQGVEGYYNGV